jgi:anti-sigma factor RsiW
MFQKRPSPRAGAQHPPAEMIESYSMGRLAASELEEFEEHLIACPKCQNLVAAEDAFTQGMRGAAQAFHPPLALGRKHRPWSLHPSPAWAFALPVIALLLFSASRFPFARHFTPTVLVSLQTTRGAVTDSIAAGQPLILAMDLTGLPQLPAYKLEVVDSTGHPVFHSQAIPQNNQVRSSLGRGLPRGAYFVRLYSSTGELLRESALAVHS